MHEKIVRHLHKLHKNFDAGLGTKKKSDRMSVFEIESDAKQLHSLCTRNGLYYSFNFYSVQMHA